MKHQSFVPLFLFIAISFSVMAQEKPYNPYEKFGKEAEVLTLSNGKYQEFFDRDSIEIIGSAVLNTNTMKVIGFVETDTLYSEATLEPEVVSRWLSRDPLAAKYPYLSPYNFVANNPIVYVDPDGRKIRPVNKTANDVVVEKAEKYGQALLISYDEEKNVFGTDNFFADFDEFKTKLQNGNSDFTKSEINEAWALYQGLSDNEVIEVTVTKTASQEGGSTREQGGYTPGSRKKGGGVLTESSEYNKFIGILEAKGELTKDVEEALYNGGVVTTVDDNLNEETHTISPDARGDGWVFFKDDDSQSGNDNVKGHIVIDGSGKSKEKLSEKIISTTKEVSENE